MQPHWPLLARLLCAINKTQRLAPTARSRVINKEVARQKLGQHFLRSQGTLDRIARAACDAGAQLVVEIGAGRGALTEHLLKRAERVVAVELDPELAAALSRRFADNKRVEIVHADAMTIDLGRWGPGALAGNLPYYIATGIISRYVRRPGPLTPATFLIQEEVAERIAATPGTTQYGYFSVECQYLARARLLFRVSPGAFEPPPKVDSAVIRLEPRSGPPPVDPDRFLAFVAACFRHKRKTLRNNLAGWGGQAAPDTHPALRRRAEELTVQDFLDLYRMIAAPLKTAASNSEADPGSGTDDIPEKPG